jgi:hypothetical protein
MRAFIDTRDLLNIFNHSRPISASELGELFVRRGHQLVIPFSLISELIPADNNPIVVARRFVKIEEDIPHIFLQQKSLPDEEIRRAAIDVSSGRPPAAYEPYVQNFRDLWSEGFDPIFLMDLDRTIGKRKMSFQLDLLVQQKPQIFHWSQAEAEQAIRALEQEQQAIKSGPAKQAFRDAVARWLSRVGLQGSDSSINQFADLLRRKPRIAPGWRLYEEVFDQLARDKHFKPTVNDVWDLAHVAMLPYIDALTLDKNKVNLVQQATRRLREFEAALDYPSRVFASVNELLSELDA